MYLGGGESRLSAKLLSAGSPIGERGESGRDPEALAGRMVRERLSFATASPAKVISPLFKSLSKSRYSNSRAEGGIYTYQLQVHRRRCTTSSGQFGKN